MTCPYPHDTPAERTVIGWALVYGSETKPAVLRVALEPWLYAAPQHAHYARAILSVLDRGETVTILTVETALQRDGRWHQVGGGLGMARLIVAAGTLYEVRAAVAWLRVLARRRAEAERLAGWDGEQRRFAERWRARVQRVA